MEPKPTVRVSIETHRRRKIALITGITGQDGSYLAELLLGKGYTVHGYVLLGSFGVVLLLTLDVWNTYTVTLNSFILHYGDLCDDTTLTRLVSQIRPTEVYNLGAQSHVKVSFQLPEYTGDVDGLGTLRLLNAIRTAGLDQHVRFFQASTSEMFGKAVETPQKETTPFYPRSPYGVAKLYAHWIVVNYREAFGIFACSGITFNHESPRRGRTFVTRKITRAAAEIAAGVSDCLYLGNLDAKRDWGHAKDYVNGMWLMLQQSEAEDLVLASGEAHSVRNFVETAFAYAGLDIRWEGEGENEVGRCERSGRTIVRIDPGYYRPTDVESLLGDPSRAEAKLGWRRTTDFNGLVAEMVQADMEELRNGEAANV